MTTTLTREHFNSVSKRHLPGLVGVEIVTISREAVQSRMAVRKEVMAPNGFLEGVCQYLRGPTLYIDWDGTVVPCCEV